MQINPPRRDRICPASSEAWEKGDGGLTYLERSVHRHKILGQNLFSTPTAAELFEQFWRAYPRREKRIDAERTWRRLKLTEAVANDILGALAWQRNLRQWRETRFIPLPATYLRGRRWTDEPPREVMAALEHRKAQQVPPEQREGLIDLRKRIDEQNMLVSQDLAEDYYRKRPWLTRPSASRT